MSSNKGNCNSPILCHSCAKYRTITSLLIVEPCFLALLPSNPIYHQHSQRECFLVTCSLYNSRALLALK